MFEFYNGGCALEKFKFGYPLEIFSTLRQVVFALAVAEESLEFEHRDLHIGNILVKPCLQDTVSFKVLGIEHQFPTESVMATIIDFTISRLKKDGCAVFCDVASDDGLFEGTGDFQFDVYRDMKKENGNDWQKFNPRTNIMWVNYLCQKLMITLKKRKDNSRLVRSMKKKLQDVLDVVLQYDSCLQLTLETELWS
uniref:non-specific serine/threonine protein kinase n=1 Tax=Biomphalaria glabrata TaxID=6526 RepID=A0A2C9KG07_BIOGL